MNADMELTDRQRRILRGVVEGYVATGQPVGSSTLVERTGLDVSSRRDASRPNAVTGTTPTACSNGWSLSWRGSRWT